MRHILEGLNLSRLDHYQQIGFPQEDGRGWFSTSGLFILPLSPTHSSKNPPWRSITRWLPGMDRWPTGTWHESAASNRSGIEKQDLLNVWNRTVQQVMASNRAVNSGIPAVMLPILSFEDADDKVEPYFLIRTDGIAHLERVSFDVPKDTQLKLCAKLIWQLQETLPGFGEEFKNDAALPRNDLGILELIGEASGYSVSDFGWPKDNDGSDNCAAMRFDGKKLSGELNVKSAEHDNGEKHPWTIFKLELKALSVRRSVAVTVGSLKLANISIADKEAASITCALKGTWNSEVCDLYPEVSIDHINCDVFISGTSDPKAADYFAVIDDVSPDDVSGRLEPYQRESAPLANEQKIIENATLSIKVRCQKGRNSVTELTLRAASREIRKVGSFYFQATPFIVANVMPPQFDEQVGEKFAYWRSDDPEGPQWRFGDATVEFTFLPQAVGEEMERGNRFYSQDITNSLDFTENEFKYGYGIDALWRKLGFANQGSVPALNGLLVEPGWHAREKQQVGRTPSGNLDRLEKDYNDDQPNLDKLKKLNRAALEEFFPLETPKLFERNRYINPEQPIKYRFSRPTKMVVRPALVDRRFNRFGANLRDVLRQADVESFTAEVMYPVEMQFKRDEQNRPDVRISEIGEFFGNPAPELPQWPSDESDKKELISELLDGKLAIWAAKPNELDNFSSGYKTIRERQSIARVHYVQRLGVFQLYDPFNRNRGLNLTEGLAFRIRGRNEGAPVMNPLPAGTDLPPSQLNSIENFDWSKPDNAGAIRAGVLHTFEFASELVAVLSLPTSKSGVIESLALSALGASGAISASFDEGRTTFSAESQYGQLSRLIKTRIGRIGVFWNRAKHVVVYERTCVPSAQFENEQGHGLDKWPILRKTEEYIELLEDERHFNSETDAKANRAGAVVGAKFLTKRIYVNGAWGADLVHGYEMPLWNEQDRSGFYPKPHIAMVAAAGEGETTRHFFDEPQSLFLYSNTEKGTGSDTDKWRAKVCVDFRAGERPGVFLGRGNAPGENKKVLERSSMPSPGKDSPRLPRFDFAVTSEGPLNLQHERGDTAMLARMDVLSLERTAQTKSAQTDASHAEKYAKAAGIGTLEDDVRRFLDRLGRVPLELPIGCDELKNRLKSELSQLKTRLIQSVDETAFPQVDPTKLAKAEEISKTFQADLKRRLLIPEELLKAQLEGLRQQVIAASETIKEAMKNGQINDSKAKAKRILLDARDSVLLQAELIDNHKNRFENEIKNKVSEWCEPDGALLNIFNGELRKLQNAMNAAAPDPSHLKENELKAAKLALKEVQRKLNNPIPVQLKGIADRISVAVESIGNVLDTTSSMLDRATPDLQNTKNYFNNFCNAYAAIKDGVRESIKKLNECVSLDVSHPLTDIVAPLTKIADRLRHGIVKDIQDKVDEIDAATDMSALANQIDKIAETLSTQASKPIDSILSQYESWAGELDFKLNSLVMAASTAASSLVSDINSLYARVGTDVKNHANTIIEELINKADHLVDGIADNCQQIEKYIRDNVTPQIDELRKNVTSVTQSAVQQLLNSDAGAQLAAIAQEAKKYEDNASQAIKLVKAIGELPELPHLAFNADRIEYAFDDAKKQIETSAFAAKLREVGDDLKALGLAEPVNELADQLVGNLKDLDFNDIFRSIGGIDFTHMFSGFSLPNLSSDNVKITHGFDKQTRTAWINSTVNVDVPQEVQAFGMGDLSVKTARMALRATSDVRMGLDGKRQAVTNGRLIGDWVLSFGGARLVTFRDVTVSFDGSGDFKFDVSPDKIELHPTISFVSDIAKKFEASLPPYIKIEKDGRGNPIGASANLVTKVESPPPLGPVLIGSITILGGLALKMDKGAFNIESHLSVGTREAPIFVQVSFLGGGLWLGATAALKGSELVYESTMGLSLGSTRYFSIAGIAQGSYSFLLFASAQFKNGGGSFVAGLLVQGNARILGFVSASISLLLQAEHSSSGETKGHGELNVSVQICWCYTFSVHQTVDQTF